VGKEAVMESRYDPLYGTEIAELQEELRQKKNRRYSAARKTTAPQFQRQTTEFPIG
jgi:hypothetical protein